MNAKPSKKQDNTIAENHRVDVENGLTETEANESDAFERHVIGIPDSHQDCCHPDFCAVRDCA